MATLSNAILIQDNKESSTPKPNTSQLRIYTRPDYSYRKFETIINILVDNDGDTIPSQKRKRTETNKRSEFVSVSHNIHALIWSKNLPEENSQEGWKGS